MSHQLKLKTDKTHLNWKEGLSDRTYHEVNFLRYVIDGYGEDYYVIGFSGEDRQYRYHHDLYSFSSCKPPSFDIRVMDGNKVFLRVFYVNIEVDPSNWKDVIKEYGCYYRLSWSFNITVEYRLNTTQFMEHVEDFSLRFYDPLSIDTGHSPIEMASKCFALEPLQNILENWDEEKWKQKLSKQAKLQYASYRDTEQEDRTAKIDMDKIRQLPTTDAMLDEKYGKKGTPIRDAFNREADAYYRDVIAKADAKKEE